MQVNGRGSERMSESGPYISIVMIFVLFRCALYRGVGFSFFGELVIL